MLDNLRDSASSSPFFEQEEELPDFLEETPAPKKPKKSSKNFLGLTPPQRFVLSTMLFITVCILGALLLMVLGRVVLPI